MKWYKKLDNSGFDDIERGGKNRQRYFDEYSGILLKPLSYMKHNFNSFALQHYHNLLSFSWLRIDLRSLPSFKPHHDQKSDIYIKKKDCLDFPNYLSSTDRIMLRMYGEGETMNDISIHLRRYHARHVKTKMGAVGTPYSIYYVHLIHSFDLQMYYIKNQL